MRKEQSGGVRSSEPCRAHLLLMLWIGLLVPATPILAQTPDTKNSAVIDEVTVTARKREESLLEVPESLTAFSSESIERADIDDLGDIGLLVPNLFMTRRLDGFPNVSVRGMGAFGNTQGVGFYLDDVQLFADATSRFGDMQRIEVLKGPQGILYGGSNIGGAVKFVSVRPDPDAVSGRVKLRYGENNYVDGEAVINVPLGGEWAARAFVFAFSDDSYLENPATPLLSGAVIDANDPDIGRTEESGVRLTVAGPISDRLWLYASARYNDLDGPNNVWVQELDGDLEYSNVVDTSFNPRHDRETSAFSLELTYSFEGMDLVSISSYNATDSRRETDLDIINENILDLVRPQELDVFTQELRLSSTNDSALQWQVGAYLLDFDRDLNSELLVRGGFCFVDPGTCDPLPGPESSDLLVALPFEFSKRTREQRAIFANLTYQLSDQLELSAGLRIDDWESTRTNLDTNISGEVGDTETLIRASLAWFPDESTTIYGTFSQGFEPGDFNLTNFAGANELFGYGAEDASQFELGYKARLFDGRMVVTAAGFYIDYKDRQFELQAADPSGGFVEGIINAGDSEQFGFEADMQLVINDYWQLSTGLGYVNAEWVDGTISPVSGADLSGMTPPNTADWSATTALDYTQDVGVESAIFARVQLRYKSDSATNSQFADTPGDAFPAWDNPAFTVVDVSLGFEWRNWTFDLYVENVLDEEYYIDVQEFPNFAGSALATVQDAVVIGTLEQPRRAVLSAKYTF